MMTDIERYSYDKLCVIFVCLKYVACRKISNYCCDRCKLKVNIHWGCVNIANSIDTVRSASVLTHFTFFFLLFFKESACRRKNTPINNGRLEVCADGGT